MSVPTFRTDERINLANAEVVLADGHAEGLELLAQTFAGFGMMSPHRCTSVDAVMEVARQREINLFVVDALLDGGDGYELVRWLRRSGLKPNAFAPVILLTGHTRAAEVFRGRDCGANFVIRKPATATVMLQRIVWVSREARGFVQAPNYVGPDRRFQMMGPPAGMKGRRQDDLSAEVGIATTPNLDQSDIDALFQPKKAAG